MRSPSPGRANGSFIALAHNGNLVNTDDLRTSLLSNGHVFESTSDTEVIAALLAEHPSRDIREALRDVIPQLRGAFSAVLLTKDEVIGFRDPYGVRPLVLGRVGEPILPVERVVGSGYHRSHAWCARSNRARSV